MPHGAEASSGFASSCLANAPVLLSFRPDIKPILLVGSLTHPYSSFPNVLVTFPVNVLKHRSWKVGPRQINVSVGGGDSGLWPLSPLSMCSRPAA